MLHSSEHVVFIGMSFIVLCLLRGSGMSQAAGGPSIVLSADTNCVVVIDGKVAGRVKSGQKGAFPLSPGIHKFSALDDDGDLWEQSGDVASGPSNMAISFEKVRADRLALSAEVASLKAGVADQKQQLARIQDQNEQLANNAELIRGERRLIVEAINHYANHYGKELGLHDSDEAAGMQLVGAASQPTLDPNGMSNAEAIAKLTEDSIGALLLWKAHRHNVAARRVGDRMAELEAALKDPLKHPRGPDQTSYLVAVRSVMNKRTPGQLITAPNRIEYRDQREDLNLTCKNIRGVGGGKKFEIRYAQDREDRPKKKKKKTLQLKARNKREGRLAVTDVVLACPKE